MRATAILLLSLLAAGCEPQQDITGSAGPACPLRKASTFNARDMNQCVAACKACDHGNTVTCTTSCNLKGAR